MSPGKGGNKHRMRWNGMGVFSTKNGSWFFRGIRGTLGYVDASRRGSRKCCKHGGGEFAEMNV